jgi:S1-C subfamily serine protease
MDRTIADRVKFATVAIGLLKENVPGCPFVVVGSGFCVDLDGVVVTCRHVVESFNNKSVAEMIKGQPTDRPARIPDVIGVRPHIFFFRSDVSKTQLFVVPVPVDVVLVATDFDLAVVRVAKHNAFPTGYPTLELADFNDLYEGVECGTCGFPLGDGLREQLGTMSSSFTFGRLSSVIPAQGVSVENLKGFQLDMTATHGNSGGPVFLVTTGRVFGVVEQAVLRPDGTHLPGILKAAPVYHLTGGPSPMLPAIKVTAPPSPR